MCLFIYEPLALSFFVNITDLKFLSLINLLYKNNIITEDKWLKALGFMLKIKPFFYKLSDASDILSNNNIYY